MAYSVGIIAFDGVEELDLVGPWEVFQGARKLDNNSFVCEIVSINGKPVAASKGMTFGVHATLTQKAYDILILPGGRGSHEQVADPAFLNTLTRLAEKAVWVCSICTGALVLAQAGLLQGRCCTTYHSYLDALEQSGKTGRVMRDARYIRDGNVLTSAGISAGIDMSLWLVGELQGEEFARRVQQYIEYFPEPPYALNTTRAEQLAAVQ